MRRLKVFKDDQTFDQRTDSLLKNVRRQMDDDLLNFGFDRRTNKQLLSSIGAGRDSDEDDDDDLMGKLLGSKGTRSLLSSHRRTDNDSLFPSRSTTTTKFGFGGNNFNRDPTAPTTTTTISKSTSVLSSDSSDPSGGPADPAGRPFCVSFDLSGFDAEDISVTCEGGVLGVSARHEVNNDGAVSVKEFNRKVQIPSNVEPEQLSSSFTVDGILTVEAPPDPQLLQQQQQQQQNQSQKSIHNTTAENKSSAQVSDISASSSIPLDTPVFTTEPSGRKKLDLVLEIGSGYDPEDVVVRLDGKHLIIEATHEVKTSGKSSKMSMHREFDLAEDVDPASVDASLSGGRLFVTGLTFKQGKCRIITS